MAITYHVEPFRKIAPEAAVYWHQHMNEVGADVGQFKLSPNFDQYCLQDDMGKLLCLSARDDGKLIGYYAATIGRHLHYESTTAYTDVFYVAPEYRRGFVGVRLFKEAEKALRAMGVERVYTPTKLKLDIGSLLERLGYNPIERVYTKVLKDNQHVSVDQEPLP